MMLARLALALLVVPALPIAPRQAGAQTFPVVPGTLEIQVGFAGIVLPEASDGTWSTQPEARVGLFVAPGLEIQIEGNVRIHPIGGTAANSIGVGAHLLWYPELGPGNRNLYLLAGAGGARNDPPERLNRASSFDPLLRGGFGYKVSLESVPVGFLNPAHLTVEYRGEYVLQDENDFVSGAVLAFSYFL